ncbi:DMT family transporter [Terrarubrum flagellatum]|uniref:DMT family transporter n=1 Tax=Terrirubrum flagellatum TaxID=2895980 RepID=UPI003144E7A8
MQRSSWSGIAAMIGAMALFAANDALVKAYGSTLPVPQSMAIRGLISTFATLVVIVAMRQTSVISAAFDRIIILRALGECAAIFCLISALTRLPIGDVTAISQVAPLFILAGAAAFYGQHVSASSWGLALLGFAGVLLIAKPGATGFDPTMGLAVLTAIGFAARDLLSGKIRSDAPAMAVALSTVAVVGLAGLVVALIRGWAPVKPEQVMGLGAAGLLLAVGQALVYLALRLAPLADVSPFNYSKTLFGAAAGYFVFRERPDLLTLAGMGLVIASGVGIAVLSSRRLPRS